MKRFISLFLILIFVLSVFTACGSSGKYIIAFDDSYEPFCSLDSKGNVVGFDAELMKLISKSEAFGIETVSASLTEIFSLLDSGEVDAVIAALIPTDEMKERYDFSDAYYGRYSLAVEKGKNKELIEKFNEGLKKIKENGKYKTLAEKYSLGETK